MRPIQAIVPMLEVPHANGLVEPDGRAVLFDKGLDPVPSTLTGNSSHTSHQRTSCTSPTGMGTT
jgi:hypothetical protein